MEVGYFYAHVGPNTNQYELNWHTACKNITVAFEQQQTNTTQQRNKQTAQVKFLKKCDNFSFKTIGFQIIGFHDIFFMTYFAILLIGVA